MSDHGCLDAEINILWYRTYCFCHFKFVQLGHHDANNVAIGIVDRATTVALLNCCIDLELPCVITDATNITDNAFGDRHVLTEDEQLEAVAGIW